jgi:transcriptional regulator with XRE-family HTH domain
MSDEAIPEWELVDRLHRSLREANLNPERMADAMGRHPNTIRNYLRGRTRPNRRVLRRWAQITGVPITWLAPDADKDTLTMRYPRLRPWRTRRATSPPPSAVA